MLSLGGSGDVEYHLSGSEGVRAGDIEHYQLNIDGLTYTHSTGSGTQWSGILEWWDTHKSSAESQSVEGFPREVVGMPRLWLPLLSEWRELSFVSLSE